MCKQLKDILFPLNILGKKKKCAKYYVEPGTSDVSITVEFEGKQVDIAYTLVREAGEYIRKKTIIPHKDSYYDSEGAIITIRRLIPLGKIRLSDNYIYFNCTNITSLIVNGEQLI